MISFVHSITRLLSILLLEHLSTSSAFLHASAAHLRHTPATPHPSACALFQKSRRSTMDASRIHLPCFRSVREGPRIPEKPEKRERGVPVPGERYTVSGAFREGHFVSETFQRRERGVVRREREVLKRRRGGVPSFRTQEVLTGTGVKEMPPGCPGGVKVWIFY